MNSTGLIAALSLVLSLSVSNDLGAAETIRIGYTNAQGAKIPVFIAKEQRIFDKYGLDVRLIHVSPGRLAVPKLVAGEIHFFLGNSEPIIEAIATEKKPLAIIASLGKERLAIYTKPSITRVEDLKGKRFGVSTPGASQDRIATRALKKLGLDPQKDVRIVATRLNTSVERLQSLARGEIDAVSATAYDVLQLGEAQSSKIRKLIELSELDILVSGADIAAGRAYLSAQRGTVRRFVQALEEALDVARRRPDIVAAAYEKYAGVSDARTLDLKVKDYYAGNPPERPYPDKRAVLSALEELKEAHPELQAEDISFFVDESLYL
ncbi:MAG TPA: ABC transporter substrate-binding protein [Candidatus Binatia bacterium]|jgi:NitT/TauT family transport system substrate-binding protein|nr:ABC transporter substrate-binding protein [Candidatus Binatia bacterium]